MKIVEALKALTAYPIPPATLHNIAEGAGLDATAELTSDMRLGKAFKRAKAGVYEFLADAPNISQGGISYSFQSSERDRFAKRASAILAELDDTSQTDVECGYIGEDF